MESYSPAVWLDESLREELLEKMPDKNTIQAAAKILWDTTKGSHEGLMELLKFCSKTRQLLVDEKVQITLLWSRSGPQFNLNRSLKASSKEFVPHTPILPIPIVKKHCFNNWIIQKTCRVCNQPLFDTDFHCPYHYPTPPWWW